MGPFGEVIANAGRWCRGCGDRRNERDARALLRSASIPRTRRSRRTPMRVQIVSTHFRPEPTGNAPYVAACADALAGTGFEVEVLAGLPHYPAWQVFPRDQWSYTESVGNLRVRRFRSYIPKRPSFVSRAAYELLHGVRFASALDRRADVIILVTPALLTAAVVRMRAAFWRSRPRLVLWMQDLYSAGIAETPGASGGLAGSVIGRIESALARSVDQVVVIHQRFQRYVTEKLGVRPDRLTVIRNWSHVRPASPSEVEQMRSALGWDRSSETIVLHAGNMGEKQGLENVVNAARYAETVGAPVRFVLMGDGNQRDSLEALGAGCPNLEFKEPAPASEFMAVLGSADVLLVNERPSMLEAAVPSKLTSYFATGRPVLAATSELSITSEELSLSGAGETVSPTDPAGLVATSIELGTRRAAQYATAGPAFVAQHLSAEAASASFVKLLRTLTGADSDTISRASTDGQGASVVP